MMKRYLFLLSCFLTAGILLAQDMPPLPDLPNQNQPAASPGLPQAVTAAPAQPATDANAVPALPALPGSPAPAAAASAPAASPGLPALPDASTGSAQATSAPAANPALPPLPNASAPAAATANPPLPSDQAQPAAAAPAAEAAPAEEAGSTSSPQAAPAEKPVKKHATTVAPWKVSKWRPNAIFDGMVLAKGGNESSRIAWTSQEVLNAFEFHGYHVVNEKGAYEGQRKSQWRTLTFKVPKSKLTVNVYIKPAGKKVWVRVRPSQPPLPAAFTKAQVEKMRKANTVAFGLLKKKFGHRMSPYYHWSSFEPQGHSQAVADEAEQVED